MDTAAYIGQQVKAIMTLVSDIDTYSPEEDMVEVLIAAMTVWGAQEAELLFSALELAFDGSESVTAPARERLNTLYALQTSIHEDEGADMPFDVQARQYIDGVKYHLAADIQDIIPLAAQLPDGISRDLTQRMTALKLELA